MSKYDCTKTLDYAHEFMRLHDEQDSCEACPLYGYGCSLGTISEKHIKSVQKWSDEHPEVPKLTKKERAFIERLDERTSICGMQEGGLGLQFYLRRIPIKDDWFAFIDPGDEWKVSDLLKLEVEDGD